MNLNPEHLARVYILIFILVISSVIYAVYQQVMFVRKQRRDLLQNYQEDPENNTITDYLDIQFRNKVQDIQQIFKVKDIIKKINMDQTVYNTKFGPISNDTHIVLIQVHSNVFYLQQLLMSLSAANGINKALLIFSHDYFGYEMNELIKRVNFAKYMQIFYPYSIQLHPNVFPGKDDQFCSEGYVCKKSKRRNPEAAQAKHHWWWGANQVFDNMKITQPQQFNNTILFLEEGDIVTIDFLYVYKLLRYGRLQHCPFCELLSLGAHKPKLSTYDKKTVISIETWTDKIPRSGIAFNRNIWNALKSNSDVFCYYNDFNWDGSFRYVAEQKWEGNVFMTAVAGPRVLRLGQCSDFDDVCKYRQVSKVTSFAKQVSDNLFPWGMIMVVFNEVNFDLKPAGSFEDIRDHELCICILLKTAYGFNVFDDFCFVFNVLNLK